MMPRIEHFKMRSSKRARSSLTGHKTDCFVLVVAAALMIGKQPKILVMCSNLDFDLKFGFMCSHLDFELQPDSDWLWDCELVHNLRANSVVRGKLQISREKIFNSF